MISLYLAVARSSFRRYATYRSATLAGIFTNSAFGVIITYTYLALWNARGHLGGYTSTQAVTYVWLGQSLMVTTAIFGGGFADELIARIRSGDIAIDLYRPVNLQLWWFASDLGRAIYHFLTRGVAPALIGGLLFRLAVPAHWYVVVEFVVAVVLGVAVSFGLRFLVVLSGFWLMDSRGLEQLAGVLGMFLSGMLLPLTLFPAAAGQVARLLPWSAMLQVPADVFLGTTRAGGAPGELGFSACWALALFLVGALLTRVATRHVVVQGG